jgi:hypothetical protein
MKPAACDLEHYSVRSRPVPRRALGRRHQSLLAFGDDLLTPGDPLPLPLVDFCPPSLGPRRPLDGAGRRDRALAVVMRSAFLQDALRLLPALLAPGETLLGEEIRARLERRGLTAPRPGCWGALTMNLIRRGIVRPTGEWAPSRGLRAHARKNQVLLVVGKGTR